MNIFIKGLSGHVVPAKHGAATKQNLVLGWVYSQLHIWTHNPTVSNRIVRLALHGDTGTRLCLSVALDEVTLKEVLNKKGAPWEEGTHLQISSA